MTKVFSLVIIFIIVEVTAQNDTDRASTSNSEENMNVTVIEKNSPDVGRPKTDGSDKTEEYEMDKAYKYFEQANVLYHHHYRSGEDQTKHFEKFEENLRLIIMMDKLSTSATFKINEFTGLSLDEFADKYTGFNVSYSDGTGVVRFSGKEAPDEIDFRSNGLDVVRHQGECRDSYVFSALGNIEMQYARKYKEAPPNLSPEQAFNCEKSGNCKKGGLPHRVMKSLMLTAGVMANQNHEKSKHRDHMKTKSACLVDESKIVVKVTSVIRLKIDKEEDLTAALAAYGPLSTAIYVSQSVKNYHSGVLHPVDCKEKANHAVLLVGYGKTNDSVPYWIIKNSWGDMWGESGYMRLIRGEGACNIGKYIATVTVEQYKQKPSTKYRASTKKITPSDSTPLSTTTSEHTTTRKKEYNIRNEERKIYYLIELPESTTTLRQGAYLSNDEDNPTDANSIVGMKIEIETSRPSRVTTDTIATDMHPKNRKTPEDIQVRPKDVSGTDSSSSVEERGEDGSSTVAIAGTAELITSKQSTVNKEQAVINAQSVSRDPALSKKRAESNERKSGTGTTEKENQSIEKPKIILNVNSNSDSSDEYGMPVLGTSN